MCASNSRPLHGADSAEAWNPRPWLVLMEDDDGGRYTVRVPAAIGRHDAKSQARDMRPDLAVLNAEEEVPTEATFPEWMDFAGIPMPSGKDEAA